MYRHLNLIEATSFWVCFVYAEVKRTFENFEIDFQSCFKAACISAEKQILIKSRKFKWSLEHRSRNTTGACIKVRAPPVFESCNDNRLAHAHTEPAVGLVGCELRILSRRLMAQHQHRAELGFAHPPNLAWDLSM